MGITLDAEQLTARFVRAQLAGDRREALRVVVDDAVERGVSIHDVHLKIIRPAQYEIGRLWHENEISIAQEHLATAIAQLALSHLYRYLKRAAPNGKRILVGCVEGETHDVGARIIADLMEADGFDAWYLGANVPTESLVSMVKSSPPDAVALSVSMSFNLPSLHSAVLALRNALGARGIVFVGGRAVAKSTETWSTGGVHLLSDEPGQLVSELRQLLNTPQAGALSAMA